MPQKFTATYLPLPVPLIISNHGGLHKKTSMKLLAVVKVGEKYSASIWKQSQLLSPHCNSVKTSFHDYKLYKKYHQLILQFSCQLRDERRYRNILETENWLIFVLLLNCSPECLQCCLHRGPKDTPAHTGAGVKSSLCTFEQSHAEVMKT